MNSEIYGGSTNLPWGFNFIRDRHWAMPLEQGGSAGLPCHPTQIYEAVIYFLIFAVCILLLCGQMPKTNKDSSSAHDRHVVSRILVEYLKNIGEPFKSVALDHRIRYGPTAKHQFVVGASVVWNAKKKSPASTLASAKRQEVVWLIGFSPMSDAPR